MRFREIEVCDYTRKAIAAVTALITAFGPGAAPAFAAPNVAKTATPIRHLVVVFQENVSFDHYFGTYPSPQIPPASRASPRERELRR